MLLYGVAALLFLVGCDSGKGKLLETPGPLIGTWGGNNIRMTIGSAETTITYACGDGVVNKPIILDAAGRFNVEGTYDVQGGGPSIATPISALYSGVISGMTMSLAVTSVDTGQSLGTFSLELGNEGVFTLLCPV
jgi:hypothetical protein